MTPLKYKNILYSYNNEPLTINLLQICTNYVMTPIKFMNFSKKHHKNKKRSE
jgi:hypothetical protein